MSFRQLHYGKLQRQFTGTKNYIPSVVGNPKDYNMLMYLTKEKKSGKDRDNQEEENRNDLK